MNYSVAGHYVHRHDLRHSFPGIEGSLLVDLIILTYGTAVIAVVHGDFFSALEVRTENLAPIDGVEGKDAVQGARAAYQVVDVGVDVQPGLVGGRKNGKNFVRQSVGHYLARTNEFTQRAQLFDFARNLD